MRLAPEIPTTAELDTRYPLIDDRLIKDKRAEVSDILSGQLSGLLAIIGPCAMTADENVINAEGDKLGALNDPGNGLVTLHRLPPWKPRSDPNAAFHGLEADSGTVELAYKIINDRANHAGNLAIEVGHTSHLDRYSERISLGWSGSRNAHQTGLIEAIALHDLSLPVAIKNSMDGTIDSALSNIELVSSLRSPASAPSTIIYRGGENARDPETWEKNYRLALEATMGRLIVDVAHGGEMAHDPNEEFKKSIVGQIACMESVIRIAEDYGELPLGVMIEASDAASPTDPVMPFDVALDGAKHLHKLRSDMLS